MGMHSPASRETAPRQAVSDAVGIGRVAAFLVVLVATPLVLAETAYRMHVQLSQRLVVVAVAASLLLAQRRVPLLRYAAAGAVLGAALYTAFVWWFFRNFTSIDDIQAAFSAVS